MLTVLLVLAGLILLLALGLLLAGALNYHHSFHRRFDGGGDYFPYFSGLHPGWTRGRVEFPSNRGDTLRGWVFSYPGPQKALIVLYHGYGMSLDDYLPECEYFCRQGYAVLAFDGSGTGASDGLLEGLPQHILDLGACLDYVNSKPDLSALPLLLCGAFIIGLLIAGMGRANADNTYYVTLRQCAAMIQLILCGWLLCYPFCPLQEERV